MSVKKITISISLSLVILIVGFVIFSYLRPLPPIESTIVSKPNNLENKQIVSWGQYGSQAIGLVGYGVNNQTGSQVPSPVASTIKVLLTLCVLNKKPLELNQQGPNITITPTDVANYTTDLSLGESVVKVEAGEVISEYQALQALLIASANNFADILVNWAFGSTAQYLTYANQFTKSIDMNSTTVADNSGFLTSTISNANNLAILGQTATTNPVVANIVDEYTAVIPVAGEIVNYNTNLNPSLNSQINGIKTGNTTAGGGNYIYSSNYSGYKLVGSIVNAPNLDDALNEAPKVLTAYEKQIKIITPVTKNQVVAYYSLPWANKILVYSPNSIKIPVEPNTNYSIYIDLDKYLPNQLNSGHIIISNKNLTIQYPIIAQNTYSTPSLWWRIDYNLKKLL
jgi:D-alanyl-D-alanine carboxypeptidase (penicillin-binding protein 5/6)